MEEGDLGSDAEGQPQVSGYETIGSAKTVPHGSSQGSSMRETALLGEDFWCSCFQCGKVRGKESLSFMPDITFSTQWLVHRRHFWKPVLCVEVSMTGWWRMAWKLQPSRTVVLSALLQRHRNSHDTAEEDGLATISSAMVFLLARIVYFMLEHV